MEENAERKSRDPKGAEGIHLTGRRRGEENERNAEMRETGRRERKRVCVLGLGFVGSAMALAVAHARDGAGNPLYDVAGIDLPTEAGTKRAESLDRGVFPFESNDASLAEAMAEAKAVGNLAAGTDPSAMDGADVVIMDINLDIGYGEGGKPILDMEPFREAVRTVGRHAPEGALVVVETTVPPGTCRLVALPVLREEFSKRGLDGRKLHVAHSYERVMPGKDYFDSIINFWRVYAGVDEASADRCEAFLRSVISTEKYPLTRLGSTDATETAKVLENSYRALNIAFMNEWGRFAEAAGIDMYEVVDAIRMRPTHSNMRIPGFGVGGYCLTKDPYFAMLAARDLYGFKGMDFFYSTHAVTTNRTMPLVCLDKVEEELGGLDGKRLLLCGVSYRQDVGDTRHSPSEDFAREAERRGAVVDCQDPLVGYWEEMDREVTKEISGFWGYDAVVFAVPHGQYREIDFAGMEFDAGTLVFDAFDVLDREQRQDIAEREDIRLSCIGR